MRRLLAIAFAATILASPAMAWQQIEWGTSIDAVMAGKLMGARPATVEETEGESIASYGKMLAVIEYKTPDFVTTGYLHFRHGGLSGVVLSLNNTGDGRLARWRLLAQYGPAAREQEDFISGCKTTVLQWRDVERRQNVSYHASDCQNSPDISRFSVRYTPFLTPNDTGL